MSAGLSLLSNYTPQAPTTEPLTSVPSTVGERVAGAWGEAQTPDRYWNIQKARHDRAQKIIDDYYGVTGERLRNPFDNAPTTEEIRENTGQPTTAIYAKRLETLKEKTAAARSTIPDLGGLPQDFLDADSIDASIASESGAARHKAEGLVGTGNGVPAFLAGSMGEMASPHGVASMFLPVSRLPVLAAEGIGANWLRNIGKEALLQGLTQAGVQVLGSTIDYNTRKPLGTQQTPEQFVEEVAGAGVGGFLFGGAFRAAHLGIRHMIAKGVDVPPAVRDASLVMESKELYGDKNALGVPAAAHEAAIDRAVGDAMAGRAASVEDIVPNIRANPEQRLTPAEIYALPPDMRRVYERERQIFKAEQAEGLVAQRLVVAREMPDGTIRYGEAGQTHADLIRPEEMKIRDGEPWFPPPDSAMGFAEPGGKFMTRDEAAAFVKENEPARSELLHEPTGLVAEQYQRGDRARTEFKKLANMMDEPSPATHPFTPPEEPGAGRPTEAGSPQDKTMDTQVRQLLEEGGGALPEHRRQYEAALQAEKETNVALGCVGGAL